MLHVKLVPFLPLPLLLLFLPLLTLDRSQHHALPAERVILNSRIGEVNQATGSRVAHLHDTLHLSIKWGRHTRRVPSKYQELTASTSAAQRISLGGTATPPSELWHTCGGDGVWPCASRSAFRSGDVNSPDGSHESPAGEQSEHGPNEQNEAGAAAARRAGRAVREYALRVTERLCRFGTRGVARTWALSVPYRIESVYDINCIEKKASVSVGLALQNFSDDVMVRCAGGSMLAAVYMVRWQPEST